MITIRPVVLAGTSQGATPALSGSKPPIQFSSLSEEDSSFQDCLERVSGPVCLPPLILCSEEQAECVQEQCDDIGFDYEEMLIVSDADRAQAVRAAVEWALGRGEEYPLLICPADHFIADPHAFDRAVTDAAHTAKEGYLVGFGAVADRAETAYGYLEVGLRLDARFSGHQVLSFVNQPDREKAQSLLDSRRYVWNTGIYCALPSLLADMLDKKQVNGSFEDRVVAKSDRLCVVSLLSAWSCISHWPGLWKALTLQEL